MDTQTETRRGPGRPPRERPMTEPSADFTTTPEFKAAVVAAAKEAVAETLASFKAAPNGGSTKEETMQVLRDMAMAIAEVNDQGSQRKRWAPEVMARMAEGAEKLRMLLAEAKHNYDEARHRRDEAGMLRWRPEYRLTAMCVLNEVMVQPWEKKGPQVPPTPVDIYWSGAPNDAMVPTNDIAKRIFSAFRQSCDGRTKIVAESGPAWITEGGLVIKGARPPARRTNQTQVVEGMFAVEEEDAAVPGFDDTFLIKGTPGVPGDPNAEFVNVLGTIAPAARRVSGLAVPPPQNGRF